MDLTAISALRAVGNTQSVVNVAPLTGDYLNTGDAAQGTLFDSILNSAIDNIKTTNAYLSDAENEEIKFALGEVDNTHDLAIALQKASTALQYTVAVRDKFLEAYREIMQMQI